MSNKQPPHHSPTPPPQTPKKNYSVPTSVLAVFLFCLWVAWNSLSPTLPKSTEPPRLYANPSEEDLRLTILKAIQKAKISIHLTMFGLSDPPIIKALSKKEIPIKIYYDPAGSPSIRKVLPNTEAHPIRQSGFMHQKILVIDDEMVFIGSANFTTHSLKMHDNLVVGIANRKIAEFLKQTPPLTPGYFRTQAGGQDVELWLLPDPKGHAISDLKKKFRGASKSLKVAIFTLTHDGLIDELIRAQKRGVEVTVIIDLHSALGASASAVETLQAAKIKVLYSQGVQLLHHKFVYIDEQTLVSGSANWTKAAFTKNSDCLLVLHNLTKEQRTFMNRLWRRLETTSKSKKF